MGRRSKRLKVAIPAILVLAFVISFLGDFYFEEHLTNPWWYTFEALVWSSALILIVASVYLIVR